MTEYLQLKNSEGFKGFQFDNLGKINILCGKNNSGKTTILKTIYNADLRNEGIKFDNDIINKFLKLLLEHYKSDLKDKNNFYSNYNLITKKILDKVNDNIYYNNNDPNEHDLLKFIFDTVYKFLSNNNFYYSYNIFTKIYSNLFKKEYVLLPPKRQIESNVIYNSNQNIHENGEGILNNLFLLKNQNIRSSQNNLYLEILKIFKEISSGYSFDIISQVDNKIILKFSIDDNNWYLAENCGLGLQELLFILYFSISPDYDFILIEEPENHIHPEMQKKILNFLKNTNKQYFISTHSNIFLNDSYVDNIYYIYYDKYIKIEEMTSKAEVLKNLGYSIIDNLISDLIILVEGPTDIPILEEFLIKMNIYHKYNIKFWPLGGDIMDQLDLQVFKQNNNIMALIDKDPGSQSCRNKFIKKCKESNIKIHKLKRYSIENYLTLEAIKNIFPDIDNSITEINHDKKLEDQIGKNIKKNTKKIVQKMTLDDIKDTDLLNFLNEIKNFCEKNFTNNNSTNN